MDFQSYQLFSRLSPQDIEPEVVSPRTLIKMESIAQNVIHRHLEHSVKSYRLLKELIAA
jgi:hypothetical protein